MRTKFDDWEEETQALADWFIKKLEYDKDDCWWFGDKIGGVLCCDQWFFNLDRIVEFFRYGATVDQLYEYYDYEISHYENTDGTNLPPVNFKNFVKYGMLEAANDETKEKN